MSEERHWTRVGKTPACLFRLLQIRVEPGPGLRDRMVVNLKAKSVPNVPTLTPSFRNVRNNQNKLRKQEKG